MQQPVVDRMCLGLQFGQVMPAAGLQPRSLGSLMTVLDAQRDAVFEVLLDPGVLVEHVQGHQLAVRYRSILVLKPTARWRGWWGRPAPLARGGTANSTFLRPAQVHVLGKQRLEERGGPGSRRRRTRVRETSTCRIDSSPPKPGGPGRRPVSGQRDPGHPPLEPHLHPCRGRNRSQICCRGRPGRRRRRTPPAAR